MSGRFTLAPMTQHLVMSGEFIFYPAIPRSSASGCTTKNGSWDGVTGFDSTKARVATLSPQLLMSICLSSGNLMALQEAAHQMPTSVVLI